MAQRAGWVSLVHGEPEVARKRGHVTGYRIPIGNREESRLYPKAVGKPCGTSLNLMSTFSGVESPVTAMAPAMILDFDSGIEQRLQVADAERLEKRRNIEGDIPFGGQPFDQLSSIRFLPDVPELVLEVRAET